MITRAVGRRSAVSSRRFQNRKRQTHNRSARRGTPQPTGMEAPIDTPAVGPCTPRALHLEGEAASLAREATNAFDYVWLRIWHAVARGVIADDLAGPLDVDLTVSAVDYPIPSLRRLLGAVLFALTAGWHTLGTSSGTEVLSILTRSRLQALFQAVVRAGISPLTTLQGWLNMRVAIDLGEPKPLLDAMLDAGAHSTSILWDVVLGAFPSVDFGILVSTRSPLCGSMDRCREMAPLLAAYMWKGGCTTRVAPWLLCMAPAPEGVRLEDILLPRGTCASCTRTGAAPMFTSERWINAQRRIQWRHIQSMLGTLRIVRGLHLRQLQPESMKFMAQCGIFGVCTSVSLAASIRDHWAAMGDNTLAIDDIFSAQVAPITNPMSTVTIPRRRAEWMATCVQVAHGAEVPQTTQARDRPRPRVSDEVANPPADSIPMPASPSPLLCCVLSDRVRMCVAATHTTEPDTEAGSEAGSEWHITGEYALVVSLFLGSE